MVIIKLSYEHLKILDEALQQLPYFKAAPVIEHINSELRANLNTPNSEESSADDSK